MYEVTYKTAQCANAHFSLGAILGARADIAGAARLFTAALEIDPANAKAKEGLQIALRMLKLKEEHPAPGIKLASASACIL